MPVVFFQLAATRIETASSIALLIARMIFKSAEAPHNNKDSAHLE